MSHNLKSMATAATIARQQNDVDNAETMTARPAATSLFCLDSDDRYRNFAQRRSAPTYPFRFSINKNESLLNGFFRRLALTEFRMAWTLPNFSKAWKNTDMLIVYRNGGSEQTELIEIPDGFYNAEDLAEALQAAIQQFIPTFTVKVLKTMDGYGPDEVFYFSTLSTTQYYFKPNGASPHRSLIDMLNIHDPLGQVFKVSETSGIPTLRPTDYVDLVCPQLTNNQNLKDSTSAPITRDMLCRIYLDSDTPSRSLSNTYNYMGMVSPNGTTLLPSIIGASAVGDVVTYTFSGPTLPSIDEPYGQLCVIKGITGNTTYNGSGRIIASSRAMMPYTVTVKLTVPPSGAGAPSFGPNSLMSLYQAFDTVSVPGATWDDSVNGTTPFVVYRNFAYPKQIRWSSQQPIGGVTFELYDDQGRSLQDLWESTYSPSSEEGHKYANSFSFNFSLLVTED